jgi:hypothetical protein
MEQLAKVLRLVHSLHVANLLYISNIYYIVIFFVKRSLSLSAESELVVMFVRCTISLGTFYYLHKRVKVFYISRI